MKRTKFSNSRKPQIKIIAKAVPNPDYIYLTNIKDVSLIAIQNNKKISFAQIDNTGQRTVSEDYIKWLFENDFAQKRIKDRPWMRKNNPEFYVVLQRHRKKYNPIFKKLCNK